MNYSYMTLLSDDSYIFGIILLNKSLKEVNSAYPLEVLVTSNVSKPVLNILEQLNLKYYVVEPLKSDEITQYNSQIDSSFAVTWHLCMTKFELFKMTQFDKIIYLDADIMVIKNLDHLFEYPHLTSALDGEYFDLWPEYPHLNAGIIVIKPDEEEYNKLIDFYKNKAYQTWDRPGCLADQEVLNMFYEDWPNRPELHLNKYYDIFAPYILDEQIEEIDREGYFIHYVGRKPWRAFQKNPIERYTEYYYDKAHNLIQEEVNLLDWNAAKAQLKIAVYGICKDEFVNVDKYVKCFSKADYLCLLDTGSTDGTWEYLQEAQKIYPNLIIDQQIITPWRYDTARNKSLELVPKDTTLYFMVDLDEIIKEDNWVQVIKDYWNPLMQRGAYVYNRRVDENTGAVVQKFIEYRIHTNGWHYEGIVHEQLNNVANSREFFSDECISVPIVVWHYPTTPNREIYIELCERGVEEEPNNWIMHLQLAAEYEVHDLYEKAANEYRKILAEQDSLQAPELGRCYASLARVLNAVGKKDEALNVLKKGRNLVPNCGDTYFIAAEIIYNERNNFQEVFDLCQQGLQNAGENYWCTIVAKESYYPYYLMGLSKYNLGEKIEALAYLAIARERNSNEEINLVFQTLVNEITSGR